MIEAGELDLARRFISAEDVDFLPKESFLTILRVWSSSPMKKDIGGYWRGMRTTPLATGLSRSFSHG